MSQVTRKLVKLSTCNAATPTLTQIKSNIFCISSNFKYAAVSMPRNKLSKNNSNKQPCLAVDVYMDNRGSCNHIYGYDLFSSCFHPDVLYNKVTCIDTKSVKQKLGCDDKKKLIGNSVEGTSGLYIKNRIFFANSIISRSYATSTNNEKTTSDSEKKNDKNNVNVDGDDRGDSNDDDRHQRSIQFKFGIEIDDGGKRLEELKRKYKELDKNDIIKLNEEENVLLKNNWKTFLGLRVTLYSISFGFFYALISSFIASKQPILDTYAKITMPLIFIAVKILIAYAANKLIQPMRTYITAAPLNFLIHRKAKVLKSSKQKPRPKN